MPYRFILMFILSVTALFSTPLKNDEDDVPANNKIQLGAYYFDGWTGEYPQHITSHLKESFANRKPKWGWVTSSQEIVDEQIMMASDAGLSFFSFCWYYSGKKKFQTEPLNNALRYYNSSKYKSKLKFCLMVANHEGFFIGPNEWVDAKAEWILQFKKSNYLKVDGKPLVILFSVPSLVNKFGSEANVKRALQSLRNDAIKNGLPGVTIAACVSGYRSSIVEAQNCGFDILTGYNYHSSGFKAGSTEIPISNMQAAENQMWNNIAYVSPLKFIPVATLNWDPRPWANAGNGYDKAPYFVGYSEKSVYKSVSSLIDWINKNKWETPKERIGLLYAWNENGEGAYLTPSQEGDDNLLRGVQKALKEK